MKVNKLRELINKKEIFNMVKELLLGDGYKGVLMNMVEELQKDETRILKESFRTVMEINSYGIEDKEQKTIVSMISSLNRDCLKDKYLQSEIVAVIESVLTDIDDAKVDKKQLCDAIAERYIENRKDVDELFDLTQTSKESLKILKQISLDELHQLSENKGYVSFDLELKADMEEAEEFRSEFSENMGFDYEEIYLSESDRGSEFTVLQFNFWEEKNQEEFKKFIDQLNETLPEQLSVVSWKAN